MLACRRNRVTLSTIVILCAALPALAQPQPKKPLQAYLDFQVGMKNAKTLADALPFLSEEYAAMLKSRPAAEGPVWLQRLKDSADMLDVVVTKETIKGANCLLEATAKDKDGASWSGKVSLMKEGSDWKLDEQGWSMTSPGTSH